MGLVKPGISALTVLAALFVLVGNAQAQPMRSLRLGYLERSGSALCLLAAAHGFFREEGLEVALIPFPDTASGEAALVAGKIDLGAFAVGATLQAVAGGRKFRIITGGGTEQSSGLLDELDPSAQQGLDDRGIVVVAGEGTDALDKTCLIKLAAALIKADLLLENKPSRAWSGIVGYRPETGQLVHFNPNPDYWHLAEVWKRLGLQAKEMPRDYLSNHVYEEIYCDALDRLVLAQGADDPALQKLVHKAICVPNCCPANSGKLLAIQGGSP